MNTRVTFVVSLTAATVLLTQLGCSHDKRGFLLPLRTSEMDLAKLETVPESQDLENTIKTALRVAFGTGAVDTWQNNRDLAPASKIAIEGKPSDKNSIQVTITVECNRSIASYGANGKAYFPDSVAFVFRVQKGLWALVEEKYHFIDRGKSD